MPHMMVSTGRALIPTGNYVEKVRGYGPIAYWPLNEPGGTVAQCLVNPAQNGTYSSDVSTWPIGTGIGDGNTAPRFDGANDVVDVQSVPFAAALDGDEGTAAIWCKVENVGVWTDAAQHYAFYTVDTADYNEYIGLFKFTTNSQLRYRYAAGGVLESISRDGVTALGWFHMAITWSAAADEVKAYYNGAQTGATQAGLGAWAGGVDVSRIGAQDAIPTNPWQGWLAHCIVFDRVLPQSIIADLATV
jgi:hypothetical protein